MFKTFIAGIILGIASAGTIVWQIPVVDQARENSLIVVHANHGNTETFHVNVPTDRILVGASDEPMNLPAGLDWPSDERFSGTRAELFKLRNSKETVVGVASRITADDEVSGNIIEWVLHLPARGSAYLLIDPQPLEDGYRIGNLQAGTREFKPLTGIVTERWVADSSGLEGAPAGRIELITAFVGEEVEEP
jgi:hypothetical protein